MAILESLARVHEGQGNHAKAIETLREAVAIEREQRSLKTSQSLARFQAELEAKDKERKIAVLTKEKDIQALTLKKQALLRNVLLGGAGLLAIIAIAGWYAWAALRRTHRALSAATTRLLQVNTDLERAIERIRHLEGILPICSHCKSIRDESGQWNQLESYITDRSDATFSHCICPTCHQEHYPQVQN